MHIISFLRNGFLLCGFRAVECLDIYPKMGMYSARQLLYRICSFLMLRQYAYSLCETFTYVLIPLLAFNLNNYVENYNKLYRFQTKQFKFSLFPE
jgi:hypothetical protein